MYSPIRVYRIESFKFCLMCASKHVETKRNLFNFVKYSITLTVKYLQLAMSSNWLCHQLAIVLLSSSCSRCEEVLIIARSQIGSTQMSVFYYTYSKQHISSYSEQNLLFTLRIFTVRNCIFRTVKYEIYFILVFA